jgi:hypothetical protein
VVLFALLFASARAAHADAASDLEKAHSAYVAHKYEDAEARLRVLLDPRAPNALKDADAIADARMYLGAVLVAEGKKDEAAAVFEHLLIDRPDYQPDPLRVSLPAVDALIDARSRLRERLAAIQAEKVRAAQEQRALLEAETRKAATRLAMLEKLATEEVITERHSRWLALVPFGVGQFQNGQDAAGWSLLVTESALVLGSAIGAGIALHDVGQANDALVRQDGTASGYQQRAQQAALVGNLFAGAFGVLAAAGIAHAELSFVPQRVQVRKRDLPPLALGRRVAPLAPLVAPLPGPGRAEGVVLGARGAF